MKCTVRRPRSRWVGPPVSAPKSELSRSPSERQRHYGAVELAGTGDQVNVNDVVEVVDNKQRQETSQRHAVLVQVLSMWEDTFTEVFKFRARWLIQAIDLPADATPRLRVTRQVFATDRSAAGSKTRSGNDEDEVDEVFLTKRVKDLEVRSIVKPITLRVSSSATAEVPPKKKGKWGPRLTHAFCEASGEFSPLEGTDPILKRARVRQANAVALASRADQEHRAAKSGKPIAKSNGWLLPKRGAFARRGGRTAAREAGGGGEIVASSCSGTGSSISPSSSSIDIKEASDDIGVEEPPNSEDGEWNEDEEGEDDHGTDTDSDSPGKSKPTLSVGEMFTQRKSARQRKSQPSPTPDAEVEDCCEAKPEAKPCPPPATAAATFQRRRRVPLQKRQGLLPPRPRRLAMPLMAEEPLITDVCEASPLATATSSVAVKAVRPARTRTSLGLRPKPSLALPRSASMEDVVKATLPLSISAKRKRNGANKSTQGASRSDYPPLRTLVGKDYQTDIPDLLSADEKKQKHTGTGAKMVWRSVQDWDQQSRGMLASYLHAAKGVVEAKQAHPGVAVHVRLGGKKISTGAEMDDNTEIASSYAVWAISSGREACGLVRVACSDMAQTNIPRSAIQRVQSQEQALVALVKARCVLDSYDPALKMLAEDLGSPESIEPWTIKQVRTLEEALVKEYDPGRRLHGWARPGMEMDREDFIDLAKVSKDVPGKTPAQVLSFYYRYLAAAEPLTDVVYGPEAAKARKQESISRVSSALDPANSSGNVSESAPKPKPRVVRLSAPKVPESVLAATRSNAGPAVESVQNDNRSTHGDYSRPACYAGDSAPKSTSTPHLPAASKHATNKVTSGGDGGSAGVYRQKRCAVKEGEVSRSFPPLPPGVEVLEVKDSDDADGGGAARGTALSASGGAPGGGEPTRPSDVYVAAQHINSMGTAGLSWMTKQMRRQAAPALDTPSRLALPGTIRGHAKYFSLMPKHKRHFDDRPNDCQIESRDVPSTGFSGPRYGRRRTAHVGTVPVPRDDTFGSMAPCWRLLERAQAYMDKDQLEYMRGLVLTHVRKPMSRDQLLERADSCLQEQGKIFAAFVKMFDRIDQPPRVPLYPAKRALHARSQSASY
ncbi:unnamed protein product, partial [Laminaria digitata]